MRKKLLIQVYRIVLLLSSLQAALLKVLAEHEGDYRLDQICGWLWIPSVQR